LHILKLGLFSAFALLSSFLKPEGIDPCKIYGSIYIADNPDRVDFFIYEESSEIFADLVIYEEENLLFADRQGIWHFTENRGQADFSIFFVDDPSRAHFSVFFTDVLSFAGCNR